MSKPKLYPCQYPDCEKECLIRSTRTYEGKKIKVCPFHAQMLKPKEVTFKKPRVSEQTKRTRKKRKEGRSCLGAFFGIHKNILTKNRKCQETGEPITSSWEMLHWHIAHILPKKKVGGFPDLQCVFENAMYLSIDMHTKYDKFLLEHDFKAIERLFPNTWSNTCKTIEKLLEQTKTRNKLYFSLKEYLENKTNE